MGASEIRQPKAPRPPDHDEFASPERPSFIQPAPMHLAAIGPFQINHELGRGVMGVVDLATDTKLDRPRADFHERTRRLQLVEYG